MEQKKPSLIFMGTPKFAKNVLDFLIEEKYEILSVFTQPDKKIGRKQEISESPVKILAKEKNIPIHQPEKLSQEIAKEISQQFPDMIIVAAYGKMIPENILKIPPFGCLNIHPSLLPELRGASPIQNALLQNKKETGITLMLMNEKMDEGDILVQEKISIFPEEKYPELSERLSIESAKLLAKTIPSWIEKKIQPQKQISQKATYCQPIKKEDGKINWQESAEKIHAKFRAFFPWPGIFTFWNGKRLKIHSLSAWKKEGSPSGIPGKISIDNNHILVETGAGHVEINEVQLEGKAVSPIKNFLNGHSDFIQSVLK